MSIGNIILTVVVLAAVIAAGGIGVVSFGRMAWYEVTDSLRHKNA